MAGHMCGRHRPARDTSGETGCTILLRFSRDSNFSFDAIVGSWRQLIFPPTEPETTEFHVKQICR